MSFLTKIGSHAKSQSWELCVNPIEQLDRSSLIYKAWYITLNLITKPWFYSGMEFMQKPWFYCETEGVWPKVNCMDKERHTTKLAFVYKLDLCVNFGQFQAPIYCTLESQNYTNMAFGEYGIYKYSKLWLLCCCFWYCHSMFLSLQVHVPY